VGATQVVLVDGKVQIDPVSLKKKPKAKPVAQE
jgi:hypothetical protein